MNIIDTLKRERERRGLTRAHIADLLCIQHSQFGQWESGAVQPSIHSAERWAAVLGLRLDLVQDGSRRSPGVRLCARCGKAPVEPGRVRYCGAVCVRGARKAREATYASRRAA